MINIKNILSIFAEYKVLDQGIKLDSLTFDFSGKIQTNSSQVGKGDVFVCIKGFSRDGHDFAEQVIKQNPALLIVERELALDYPQIQVNNARRATALLAKLFYDNPSGKFTLIGVTGTNGKTTTTKLIEQLLLQSGKKTGLIGTLGYCINGVQYESERTTPDILDLNAIFLKMLAEKVEVVVMEVSSHSLALDRVFGLMFDIAVFTNLSRDHLDFHKDLQDYADWKFELFKYNQENKGIAFINIDDVCGAGFYKQISGKKVSLSFINEADVTIENCSLELNKTRFALRRGTKLEEFETSLTGKYNVMNLTSAILVVEEVLKNSMHSLQGLVKNLTSVEGRMQSIENELGLGIFVDYAHTPDALENVLQTLHQIKTKRIICLLGAGGDRDKGKRPQMTDIALKYADICCITSDNPRSENPADIIRDMTGHLNDVKKIVIIENRKTAIETVIAMANAEDIVLLAGKGQETYQEIKGIKHPFDDRLIAAEACRNYESLRLRDGLKVPLDPQMLGYIFRQSIVSWSEELNFITTDSRDIKSKSLFIALKGERFDGHAYIESVLKDESIWVIAEESYQTDNPRVIKVKDTVVAYNVLASYYLNYFDLYRVALTGSVGKTTSKEYIYNVLQELGVTHKTKENENNLIGLPKTIFGLNFMHRVAIFELGTNHFGEIAQLAATCEPDIGIITNIGPSHLEFFGTLEGVLKEKINLALRSKMALIPGDDPLFVNYKKWFKSFGFEKDNDYVLERLEKKSEGQIFSVNRTTYHINNDIDFHVLSAAMAVITGKLLGLSETAIQKGLNRNLELNNRLDIRRNKQQIIIFDCYNANPTSMLAALDYWEQYLPDRPHIAILGDMLELGEKSFDYHHQVWERLVEMDNKFVISVGSYSEAYDADIHFPHVDKLLESDIFASFPETAVILLKASHGIHLEKLTGRF